MSGATILLADDDAAIRTVIARALGRAGFDVRATGNGATLWQWISNGEGVLVISDVLMPDVNAFDLLPRIKKLRPELPVIVISAQNTLATALTATERGAYDYLPKPFDLNELTTLVTRALAQIEARAQGEEVANDDIGDGLPLIGRSPAMQEIYRAVARLTQNDLSVLITGESGTGKELVARALHDYGARRDGQFVALNMAAIPKDLIESELFGYEKGAFTGANERVQGRFAQAENGTLFLDEIGDMPMETQTRLLRVLQEGEYSLVGGRQSVATNARIITATHHDIQALIAQGLFREDLYFRLNVVPLRLPPLRERREDIPDLVRHFLRAAAREGLGTRNFTTAALDLLKQQNWAGNVRELENFVRRIAALHVEEQISAELIRGELPSPITAESGGLADSVATHVARYFASHEGALPDGELYAQVLREVERPLISLALEAANGNQLKVAAMLGINRNTLRKKIRELGIVVKRGENG